ncbi:alkaline phosphatase family protein [Sciscionella marina]|uniref:alkaline phosphatase family protein n=1 Tax=Sciscionella marina TaxID=508770 RepID=UPI0003A6635D|nr:alkaline phosphatase family protein [Sciscionella marina]
MTELTRRGLLGLAASGAAASLLPPSVHRAIAAQAPRRDGLGAIGHIVVFMQENRAFDHYFGRLRGVRGFGDATAIELPDGEPVWSQPGPLAKRVLPFALRAGAEREGRPDSDIQYLDSLDHSWAGSTAAHAKGWCDGWIAAKGAATMTYYERRDIGMQYELADTFTVCDAYHCSIFGSTNPNRTYLWSGMVGTEPGSRKRAVDNDAYDKNHSGYTWTTYPERLEAAGVSWRIYQEWDNFTDNAVEYFRPFKKIGDTLLAAVDGNYRTTEEFYESLPGKSAARREELLGQLAAARAALPEAQRNLFDRAMYRSEPDTLVERIRADIEARTLPKVTWIVAPAVYAEHPGSSTRWAART